MTTFDAIVIGAGIAGASAGYALAERARVVVLERESAPGYHTTGRSAATYLETYGNRVIRALTPLTGRFLDAPPPGFAEHPILTPRGALLIATAEQRDLLDRVFREVRELGAVVERLDGAGARRLVPALRPDHVAEAFLEPGARDIDVHGLHQGFLRGLHARGGRVLTGCEATSLERRGGRWRVRASAGEFEAPIVVNAAGAWADEIARLAGLAPIGLVPKRRTAFVFEAPEADRATAWPICGDIAEQFYFKPEAGRFLGSPADETPSPPCDAQPEEIDVALAIDRIERATTLKVRRITRRWAGLRCFVADKSPVAGFAPDGEGFFWLAGQGGYGIQTSAALAACTAALIRGSDLPAEMRAAGLSAADLSPARLTGSPYT